MCLDSLHFFNAQIISYSTSATASSWFLNNFDINFFDSFLSSCDKMFQADLVHFVFYPRLRSSHFPQRAIFPQWDIVFVFCCCCCCLLFWAAPKAYESSQVRVQIGTGTAGLQQRHIRAPSLRPTPRRMAMQILDSLSKARNRTCILMDSSQICFHCTTMGTLGNSL